MTVGVIRIQASRDWARVILERRPTEAGAYFVVLMGVLR